MPIVGVPTTIAAIYKTSAGQSIPNNSETVVNFNLKEKDTHAAVATGEAWAFTAPSSGFYLVSAAIMFAASTGWADVEAGHLALYVNNAWVGQFARKDSYGSASSVYMQLCGSRLVYLNAGDYLDVRAYQISGAVLALHTSVGYNYVSIVKV